MFKFNNRKRVIAATLAGILGVVLMSGAGGGGCAPEPSGNTAQKGPGAGAPKAAPAHNLHARLVVRWEKRTVAGTLAVSWSVEGDNNRTEIPVKNAGQFTHDVEVPPNDIAVASVEQSTGGVVRCWYIELTPQGRELDRITPIETMTTPGFSLDCNLHNPAHVD